MGLSIFIQSHSRCESFSAPVWRDRPDAFSARRRRWPLLCSRPPPVRELRNVRHGPMVSVCSGPAVAALPQCIPRLLRVGSSRVEEPVSDSSAHVCRPVFLRGCPVVGAY